MNIALTGPYGSGKSSVLHTLQQNFKEYNYLSISLATLKSYNEKEYKEEDTAKLNTRIEYSILQQLAYKEKQETLYKSRFKRISYKSECSLKTMAAMIVLYLGCLIVVFEPEKLKIDWLTEWLSNPTLNVTADIFSLLYIIWATFWFVYKILKSFGNSKLSKLNLTGGEIELEDETSVLNKHLDEIIYFFQATEYNVVIIEDLDRFDNTDIFLKLREINHLLNQSNAIEREIFFIYAVRDDLFVDEDRTKFFDYITTVIPIINSSNSFDMMKEELKNKGINDLDEEKLESISFFINDMRLLRNITNEYAQYREKLDSNLDQNKLLAMIVYKNYYPKDFADLHKGEGIIYRSLHNKNFLITDQNKKIDEKFAKVQNMIGCAKATNPLQEKELRLVYVNEYLNDLHLQFGIKGYVLFQIGGGYRSPDEIIKDESLFNSFIQQPKLNYEIIYRNNSSTGSVSNDFKRIENLVNKDFSYKERLTSIREGERNLIEQIKNLESSRNNHFATPIKNLLDGINIQECDEFKDLKDKPMLESFLKEGLIDEDYYDYISFFFGKSITKHDHDFILDLKLGRTMPYDYAIDKVDQCVKNIPLKNFSGDNILNIQVVDYICKHLTEANNDSKLYAISKLIVKNSKWDFMLEFYNKVENSNLLFMKVASIKDSIWDEIKAYGKDDLYEAWIRFNECDHPSIDSKNWIADHYHFIANRVDKIGLDNIKKIVISEDIKFTSIDSESPELLEYVTFENAYILTHANVSCAFAHCRNERNYEANSYPLNLTIVKNCDDASFIREYLYENLGDTLVKVFITESAKEESSEVIVELLKSGQIDEETKRNYLSGQKNKISLNDIENYIESGYWTLALDLDLIKPEWSEVYRFFEFQGNNIDEKLQKFIENHIDELSDVSQLQETQKETLVNALLLTSKFKIEVYEKLVLIFSESKIVDTDLNSVDDEHLKYLIKHDKIPYSNWYTEHIRKFHREVLNDYVDKYLDKCIENISLLPKDQDMFKHLMHQLKGQVDQSITIIRNYLPNMVWDSEIANMVVPYMIDHSEDFNSDVENQAIELCENN